MARFITGLIVTVFSGISLMVVDKLFLEKVLSPFVKFLHEEVAREIKKPWGDPNPFKNWEYDWEKIDKRK